MIPQNLMELVSEARLALSLPYQAKVRECVRVMPLLLDALDQVSLVEYQLGEIRKDLAAAVGVLRDRLEEARRTHFGRVQAERHVYDAVLAVNDCLDRFDELIVKG